MNKLSKNLVLRRYALATNGVCFVLLGLIALVRTVLGIEEQALYEKYPVSWWAATALGLAFALSLVYAVKKNVDVNPNIQLRSKPDEFLEGILADPEYQLWHEEANRLLDHRQSEGDNPKPEVPRWISWPLIGLMFLLLALVLLIIIGATIASFLD